MRVYADFYSKSIINQTAEEAAKRVQLFVTVAPRDSTPNSVVLATTLALGAARSVPAGTTARVRGRSWPISITKKGLPQVRSYLIGPSRRDCSPRSLSKS